jgi:hypothetical protein
MSKDKKKAANPEKKKTASDYQSGKTTSPKIEIISKNKKPK